MEPCLISNQTQAPDLTPNDQGPRDTLRHKTDIPHMNPVKHGVVLHTKPHCSCQCRLSLCYHSDLQISDAGFSPPAGDMRLKCFAAAISQFCRWEYLYRLHRGPPLEKPQPSLFFYPVHPAFPLCS